VSEEGVVVVVVVVVVKDGFMDISDDDAE